MNIGSLKITAKQGAGISDIPPLLQSAELDYKPKLILTSFLKTENRAGGKVFA